MAEASEVIRLQAEHHPVEQTADFETVEAACLYLMHLRAYTEAARLVAGGRLLDVGCNGGYGCSILAGSAATVVGIDVSETAIQVARQTVRQPNVSFRRVNGEALPFEAGEFDVVTAFQLIEHLHDPAPFLSDVARVLKPGGRFMLTTPNASMRLDPGMKPWNVFHVREYSATELGALLRMTFPTVEIRGLFSDGELYDIERNRVEKQRAIARGGTSLRPRAWDLRAEVMERAKRVLPSAVLGALRTLKARLSSSSSAGATVSKSGRGTDLLRRHGPDDFHYRSTALDLALDFFVVCEK